MTVGRLWIAVVLMALCAFAGCVSPPVEPTPKYTIASTGDWFGSDCTTWDLLPPVRPDDVRSLVPEELDLAEHKLQFFVGTGDLTALARLTIEECATLQMDAETFAGPFRWATLAVLVHAFGQDQFYVVDLIVSDPEAASRLSGRGLPARAGHIEASPLPGGLEWTLGSGDDDVQLTWVDPRPQTASLRGGALTYLGGPVEALLALDIVHTHLPSYSYAYDNRASLIEAQGPAWGQAFGEEQRPILDVPRFAQGSTRWSLAPAFSS